MITKTLLVDQPVNMVSGVYSDTGTVVKITSRGVEVQTGVKQLDGSWNSHELLYFDINGTQCYGPNGPLGRWDILGAYECGPWKLSA
jgi:hypothetical protein